MQWVTPGIGYTFSPVEQTLRDAFVPSLFQSFGEGTPRRVITCLLMKEAGLALPEQTKTAPENWTASCVITVYLIAAIRVQEELQKADQSTCLQ